MCEGWKHLPRRSNPFGCQGPALVNRLFPCHFVRSKRLCCSLRSMPLSSSGILSRSLEQDVKCWWEQGKKTGGGSTRPICIKLGPQVHMITTSNVCHMVGLVFSRLPSGLEWVSVFMGMALTWVSTTSVRSHDSRSSRTSCLLLHWAPELPLSSLTFGSTV